MPAAASPRQLRRSGVILPEDPSDEELARNWTLSESDQRVRVLLCAGREENRRRFASAVRCCAAKVGMGDCWNRRKRHRFVSLIMWERSSLCRRSCLCVEPGEQRRKRSMPNESGATWATSGFIPTCSESLPTGWPSAL